MVILGLGLAWAEEPAPEVAPAPAPEVAPAPAPAPAPLPDEEVVVYGELLVEQARQEVVQQLRDMGFTYEVTELPDRTIYRHGAPWAGEVVLFDDGWMQVQRQPMRVEGRQMPWARLDSPGAWVGCLVWPWMCVRTSGATFSRLKWRGQETRTVDAIQPQVKNWADRVADLATDRTVVELVPRLEILWTEGLPLSQGPILQTPTERRAALLDYYASRTDTVWGEQVRVAVGAFCRAVVQSSDTPFTEDELAAFAAAHPDLPSPLAPARDLDDQDVP